MRNTFRFLTHVCSIVIVLAVVFAVGHRDAVAHAAGADRMYTFNMSFDGMQGNLILVQSNGQWGLLDAGHRNADTIQDANGRIISVPEEEQYSNQISMRNGKDVAQYMINVLGVTHLDFIVGTHSHMDHIGGVPEIARTSFRDSSGRTRYLVDSSTTYFYKEYQHIADYEDDLANYSDMSFHNQAYYYQAVKTMQSRGANMVDVSKQQVIHGDPGNAYGDYIPFTMGNMSFRLYNVHEQTNTGNENVNSIVTVMTNGDYTVVNLSDINTNNGAIDKTSKAIGKNFGAVDVVVAGHHGYEGSNTKAMFDALQPHFVVVSNGSGHDSWVYTDSDLAAAMPYAESKLGTSFFSTGLSPYAIVTDLSGNKVYIYNLEYNGKLTDAFYKAIKSSNQTGWIPWVNTGGTLWCYLEGGQPARDTWRQINGEWYHFDRDGIMSTGWVDGRYFCRGDGAMVTGWQMLDGRWYYFSREGSKIANGWDEINGDWYHFNADGIMSTGWVDGRYYCSPDGAMVTGWKCLDDGWYYFTREGSKIADGWEEINGDWYHFNGKGVMETGWILNNLYFCYDSGVMARDCWEFLGDGWYYFSHEGSKILNGWEEINGEWYHFDANGVMETGWVDGHRYYCRESGAMAHDCWECFDGKWYYFSTEGAMIANDWKEIDHDWYHFDKDGVMETGWVDGDRYYCREDGRMITGWGNVDGKWYYFSKEGGAKIIDGWNKIDGDWYFLNSEGIMQTGWIDNRCYCYPSGKMAHDCWENLDGSWYYFSSDGPKLTDGWHSIEGDWYFMDADGVMQTGWIENRCYCYPSGKMAHDCWENLDGSWYYFSSDGPKLTDGWHNIEGRWFFLDADGVMQTGWINVDGAAYYLEGSGAMVTGWQNIDGKDYYFDSSGIMARDTTVDGYYVNADGVWIP